MPATALTYYKPTEGTKLIVKLTDDEGKNMADSIAERLFRVAYTEVPQPSLEGQPFQPNYVYEFANGLVFRLFDDGLNINDKVLEFYVPEEHQANKEQVLGRIPRLLQMANVKESALAPLKEALGNRFPSEPSR